MQLTKEWLVKHHACNSGIQAFISQKERDSVKILKLLIRSKKRINLQWANWLITKLFQTKKQSIQYAVFAAKLILPVFEKEYPENLGSRKAIEAVENWLKNPSEESREACRKAAASAASAAYAASYAAATAAHAAASYAAADAASAATSAASAAYAASYAAATAATDVAYTVYNQTLTKILKHGITLLK